MTNDVHGSISRENENETSKKKQFKKIRKYKKFPIFTHHLRTFCETLLRMFVSVAYISVRMFLHKYISEAGPRRLFYKEGQQLAQD